MRINVYAEELTDQVELLVKEGVIGANGVPVTFFGVRFYLKGPDDLHHTEHDDDRPAVTFWAHNTFEGQRDLQDLLRFAADRLHELMPPASLGTAHDAMVQVTES
jgi:hypothetical protein